jgi:sporulation protein YlmC with PRC-barrel domain
LCLLLFGQTLRQLTRQKRCEIEIAVGAKVEDINGKVLGSVRNIVRDSWTGEVTKFSVSSEQADWVLFYSPQDISESTETRIKLKIALGDVNSAIQYGAKVFDKNNRLVGTVVYPISDSLTGEVKKFQVKTEPDKENLLFSLEDVDKITPEQIKLKIEAPKSNK